MTTLKRNGSDYSATILGALFQSGHITIWTDVDGVYSADPRKVQTCPCRVVWCGVRWGAMRWQSPGKLLAGWLGAGSVGFAAFGGVLLWLLVLWLWAGWRGADGARPNRAVTPSLP